MGAGWGRALGGSLHSLAGKDAHSAGQNRGAGWGRWGETLSLVRPETGRAGTQDRDVRGALLPRSSLLEAAASGSPLLHPVPGYFRRRFPSPYPSCDPAPPSGRLGTRPFQACVLQPVVPGTCSRGPAACWCC